MTVRDRDRLSLRPAASRADCAILAVYEAHPRPAGLLVWTLGAVALHAAVPFELSRLGNRPERPGWTAPGPRSAGLATVAAGAALMGWAFAARYQAAPQG